jgi:hypothetical protein
MKKYEPPKRLVQLGRVLQYDSERQEIGFSSLLSIENRILINQERGMIMKGNFDYKQLIDTKINSILLEIRKENWKPKTDIQYD